jgi:hypothetical protein
MEACSGVNEAFLFSRKGGEIQVWGSVERKNLGEFVFLRKNLDDGYALNR